MDLGLKGKRALVTGGSKGIGLAVAQSLAAEGCRLDLAGRGSAALEQARDALRRAAPDIDVRIHAVDLQTSRIRNASRPPVPSRHPRQQRRLRQTSGNQR